MPFRLSPGPPMLSYETERNLMPDSITEPITILLACPENIPVDALAKQALDLSGILCLR